MNENQWEQFGDLTERLKKMPASERSRVLDKLQEGEAVDPVVLDNARKDLEIIPPPEDRLRGEKIDNYTILELIGEGGMGSVYRAKESPSRLVALKIMEPHQVRPESFAFFEKEMESLFA